MKLHYGTRVNRPAPRHRLVIQEREYATLADYRRACSMLRRYWRPLVGHLNLLCNGTAANGVPRLYLCRDFTPAELTAAGYDPAAFYADDAARKVVNR